MKYKIDMNLLYELASINIVEAEISKLKRLREKELYKMMPKVQICKSENAKNRSLIAFLH